MPATSTGRSRRGRRAVLGTILVAVVAGALTLSGTSYGALLLDRAAYTARVAWPIAPSLDPEPRPAPPTPAQRPANQDVAPVVQVEPRPAVLEPGDSGVKVRELQARLAQLAWFPPMTTGTYGPGTRNAVRGFQGKRGFDVTGVVDTKTWRRLLAMSDQPTRAELFNRPGPTLLGPASRGPAVRELEARLRQIAWFFGDVDGRYDAQTREAVSGFQEKRGIPVTGEVDQRTLGLLEAMTTEPTADSLANRAPDPADGAPLDPRCLTGAALCIDKTSNSLRWVVDGSVRGAVDVRFGSSELPTREGQFSVYRKSRDHVSSLYDTPMPFAMFFSGGQAVHYSPDFAANGYNGASHGCVNVRDYSAIAALYDQIPIGTKVIVYRS